MHYDPFKEKLQRTLEQYEAAMDEPEGFRNPQERDIAAKVVNDLRNQLLNIDRISKRGETERDMKSMIKSVSTSIEDRRIRGLREIFGFYAQQHLPEGLEFGDILNKQNILDLGEFLIFSKDFQLPLNKKKIIEIFKKTSSLRQLPVNFEEFCEVIKKIGVEINNEKIAGVKKRLKEIRKLEAEQKAKTPKEETKGGGTTTNKDATTTNKDGTTSNQDGTTSNQDGTTTNKDATTHKDGDETSRANESRTETFTTKKNQDDEDSDGKSKTVLESKKSIGQTSKSGVDSDDDSGSESKSKTTKKTRKTSKTSRTSKVGEESGDESASGSQSPLSAKSKNKSVRFSTLGKRRKSQIEHSEIDERRSLEVIHEDPLQDKKDELPKIPLDPVAIEKNRLESELEKFTSKSVEVCHEDIMNYLECHDPQKFRKRAKGVQNVPFAMKDFYYRISKGEEPKGKRTTKLSAAQIRQKVEAMKKRREEVKKKNQVEREAIKAKQKMLEERRKNNPRIAKMRLNNAMKKGNLDDDGISEMGGGMYDQTPNQKQSYRVRKNKEKGLPEDEGLNTKVTLDLLQKLHYKDIQQSMPDDFKPEKYVTEPDDDDEDESVFDYFFPGNKKKKPKKNTKGNNYSEKIMNMKREYNGTGQSRMNQDVIFEEPESMYKSDKESRRTKTNRSIQPSNPAQSKKSHRRAESQVALHNKGNKDFMIGSRKQNKKKGLNDLRGTKKKYQTNGGMTSRAQNSNKRLPQARSKSKDRNMGGPGSKKLHKSNTKSHIMGKVAKIEDMRKKQERNNLERAMKIHNNQMRKSQKYIR